VRPGNPRIEPLIAIAALTLLVFVLLPASIYLGNIHEFLTAPGPIIGALLVPALVTLGTAIVALRLGGRQDFSRLGAVIAALTLLAWAQAYLLVWDYGPLDGSPIDWDAAAWRGWVDLPLWIAGLSAAAVLHRRLSKPLATGAFTVVALQVAVLAGDGITHRDVLESRPSQHVATNEFDAMARFSPDRNVVHIILDSFQADVFKEIINGPAGPWFRTTMDGFTFFEEHLGTFPGTFYSLPVIVSGQAFRNHMPRTQFIKSAFADKSILNAAKDAGFEVDIASEAMMLDMLMQGRFDNAYLVARPPLAEDAARLLDLALFRLAPHRLKRHVYNEERWLAQRLITSSDLLRFHYFTHNSFLSDVTRRFAADRKAPVYKFFHLMTTHRPFVVNPDCSYAGQVLQRSRETVTAQSRCSLAFIVALLERMKQAGIYERSLIVLMGDHGELVPPLRYRDHTFVQDDYEYDLPPHLVGLATPLLAIKPPGGSHPFEVSSTLTSMTDLPATIDALMGFGASFPGRSMMDGAREPATERRFYGFQWNKNEPISEYIESIQEYIVTGSAYEIDSWHVGMRFPRPDGAGSNAP